MPSCTNCNDTGVIETGNNDIPCHCPAGDTAVFNVCGEGQLTGAFIKHRNSLPQPPTKSSDRTAFGHHFQWRDHAQCWRSTAGQQVYVVPPTAEHDSWFVNIPSQSRSEEVAGHDAEMRAFVIAEAYTRQMASAA